MPAAASKTEDFDATLKDLTPKGFSFGHKLCFGVNALITSAIPAYLFISKFFSVELTYYPVFIAVTIICSILLILIYLKLAGEEFSRVMERKRHFGEELNEKSARKEAASYSMFITNLIFVCTVALLTFAVMPRLSINLPTYVIYAIIAGLSGVVCFGFGYGFI